MAEKKEYFVWSNGTYIPVTQEVYQTCHQTKRYAKTLYEKDTRHNLVSYDGMDTEDILGVETISDPGAPSVEDMAIANILHIELHRCLAMLDASDRWLVHALYFKGMSERQLAEYTGIPQRTINDRKKRILGSLKKLLEN